MTNRSNRSGTRASRRLAEAVVAAVLLCATGGAAAAADAFKTVYDKGAAAFGAGDYAAALEHFEKAYKLKPHPLCLFNMGQAHRKMDHVDEAIAAYEKYLATRPAADLEAETRGYLADLKKAKEARVESDEARRLFGTGDFAGAAARYERAYSIRPEPSLLYGTGLAYEKAGNKVKAIEFYERFLRTDTDPKLRAEAEASLRSLRAEPDPAGKGGAPGVGPGAGALAPGEPVLDPEPPKRGGSNVVLFASLGAGAAVVAAGVVVLAIVLGGGPKVPDTGLMSMDAVF